MPRTRNIKFIIFFIGLGYLAMSMGTFFLALLLKNYLFFTGGQIGIMMAVFMIVGLLSVLPGGILSDRIDAKKMIGWSLLGLSFFHAGVLFSTWFLLPLIIFIIGGVSWNLFKITTNAFVLKNLHFQDSVKLLGLFTMIVHFGRAIGEVMGGVILEKFSFPVLFMVSSIIFLILSFLSHKLPPTQTVPSKIALYKNDILNNPKAIFLIIIFMLFAFHFGAELTSYALFLEENLKLSRTGIGLYMAGEDVTLGVFAYIFALQISKKKDFGIYLYYGLAFSAIGSMGMVLTKYVGISFMFRFIHGIGDGAIILLTMVGITRLFRKDRYGGHQGVVTFALVLGGFVSSLIFGPMGDSYGYAWPLFISGILTMIVLFIALIYGRKYFRT